MKAVLSVELRATVSALTLLLTSPCFTANAVAQMRSVAAPEMAPTTRIDLRPGAETATIVKAAPNAVCILHPQGVTDAAHVMNLFVDSEGQVRFHVTARQESEQAVEMQLDCGSSDGKMTTYPLELNASESALELLSSRQAATLPKGAAMRPGLSEADVNTLSDEELALRKYPPRPDVAASPQAYATWLRIVSQPVTLVPAGAVTRPDISHNHGQVKAATGTTSNWSGYELRGSGRSYDVVEGQWYVPSVSSYLGVHAYSAYWVGLDGDGTSDLVQAGTEQEYYDFSIFSFSNYYAWSELLPNQPTESEITGIPANPGDEVFTEVWIGNSNGALNQNGGYGLFYYHNLTTGQATEFETPLSGTYFNGKEAEWIMERPTVGGTLPNLADYTAAVTSSAWAETVSGPWTTYQPSSHINITMINNYVNYDDNDTLSTVQQDGSTSMLFTWKNFH
jgi:hypothetical protein